MLYLYFMLVLLGVQDAWWMQVLSHRYYSGDLHPPPPPRPAHTHKLWYNATQVRWVVPSSPTQPPTSKPLQQLKLVGRH
jgi:hypothetical protein